MKISWTWSDGRGHQEAPGDPCIVIGGSAGSGAEKSTKQPQLLTCTSETSCGALSFVTVALTDRLSRFPFAGSTLLFPGIHCPLDGQELLGEVQLPGCIEEM